MRRVVGSSMLPTLKNGQFVLAKRKKFKLGDIVIARLEGKEIIKRVTGIEPITLSGDNINSAKYDDVKESDILGVLLWPKIKH